MALLMEVAEHIDRRFGMLVNGTVEIEKLHDKCRWAEGPVWMPDANQLVWSDIPNTRMLRWTPGGGVSVFRADSNYSNGNTRDRNGRLITCEHGARRVTRTEADGSITVIADKYRASGSTRRTTRW
jgi:gluconolactonase